MNSNIAQQKLLKYSSHEMFIVINIGIKYIRVAQRQYKYYSRSEFDGVCNNNEHFSIIYSQSYTLLFYFSKLCIKYI